MPIPLREKQSSYSSHSMYGIFFVWHISVIGHVYSSASSNSTSRGCILNLWEQAGKCHGKKLTFPKYATHGWMLLSLMGCAIFKSHRDIRVLFHQFSLWTLWFWLKAISSSDSFSSALSRAFPTCYNTHYWLSLSTGICSTAFLSIFFVLILSPGLLSDFRQKAGPVLPLYTIDRNMQ